MLHLDRALTTLIAVALLTLPSPLSATLIDRGNGLIYDDVLKITWLQDAGFGGARTFADAVAWAAVLEFGGFDDWRLPSFDANGDNETVFCEDVPIEAECRDSELGYMYFWNLTPAGDTPPTDRRTDLTGNQGLIHNIQIDATAGSPTEGQAYYWYGPAPLPFPECVFEFTTGEGNGCDFGDGLAFAWVVRDGDVLATPEPPTVLLVAAVLAGLGFSRRRKLH